MKDTLSVTVDRDILAEVDRRRGLRSRSSFVQLLLERGLLDTDLAFLPPPLRDARGD